MYLCPPPLSVIVIMSSFVIFWLTPPLPLRWWRHLWTAPYHVNRNLSWKIHTVSHQSTKELSHLDQKISKSNAITLKEFFNEGQLTLKKPTKSTDIIYGQPQRHNIGVRVCTPAGCNQIWYILKFYIWRLVMIGFMSKKDAGDEMALGWDGGNLW